MKRPEGEPEYKICIYKIKQPNFQYVFDQKYFTKKELDDIIEHIEFTIEFMDRKDKREEKLEGLRRSLAKLKELVK